MNCLSLGVWSLILIVSGLFIKDSWDIRKYNSKYENRLNFTIGGIVLIISIFMIYFSLIN